MNFSFQPISTSRSRMQSPAQQPISLALSCFAFLFWTCILIKRQTSDDPYKCLATKSKGQWVHDHLSHSRVVTTSHWQVPGCMLHSYTPKEIDQCLAHRAIVFVGDSSVRNLFWATAQRMNSTKALDGMHITEMHQDLTFGKLTFLWDPYLNGTLPTWLREPSSIQASWPEPRNGYIGPISKRPTEFPRYIKPTATDTSLPFTVLGSGLWHAHHLGEQYMTHFVQDIKHFIASSRQGSRLMFIPIVVPLHPTGNRSATLTSRRILPMNSFLRDSAQLGKIHFLENFSAVVQHPAAFEEDGVHLSKQISATQSHLLLNLLCNNNPAVGRYPYDKTCCADLPVIGWAQDMWLFVLVGSFWHWALFLPKKFVSKNHRHLGGMTFSKTLLSEVAVICYAAYYSFSADRTILFEKRQKLVNELAFGAIASIVLAIGTISAIVRWPAKQIFEAPRSFTEGSFLSRQQTEEWKGWMQVLILLYHYFGMSRVLWAYQLVRLLVASYLFMTGYGHTMFFLKTSDYSLRRVTAVLLRLNMLSCVLAYTMRTDYEFYYFPALSSFWFLVVYLTLRVRRRECENIYALGAKILLSMGTVRLFIQCPGLLEFLCKALHLIFRMNLNPAEFRFRVSLDINIVYLGVLMGWQHHHKASSNVATCICRTLTKYSSILPMTASFAFSIGYFGLGRSFHDKFEYNKWHPYISAGPILAYITFRNGSQALRHTHSPLFAWLGRCSLETFILQYHIWLAADTKGLLGSNLSWLGRWDALILTVFFIWVSWLVSHATSVLTAAFVTGDTGVEACALCTNAASNSSERMLLLRLSVLATVLITSNWLY